MPKVTDYFNKPLNLLPNYFKKIGLGFILATVVFLVSVKIFGIHLTAEKKEMMKTILWDILILGMLFIAFSKEKDEDELTMLIRMKALASAFVYVVIFKIVDDVFSLFNQASTLDMHGYFFQMMIWYFFIYYSSKLFLKREK
jgi:hypothetical protein